MGTTTWTILPKLQSLGIILLILGSGVRPLLTLGTGKINNNPSFSFLGHSLLYDTAKGTSAYRFTPFPNSKA